MAEVLREKGCVPSDESMCSLFKRAGAAKTCPLVLRETSHRGRF